MLVVRIATKLGRRIKKVTSSLLALSLIMTATTFFITPTPAYAVAGDGQVIYGVGTDAIPKYRSWTASTSTWTAETNMQTAAATINFTVVQSSPTTTGRRIAGTLGTAASNNLVIQRWNGSVWSSEWSVTNSQNTYRGFDIAYENLSGDCLVVYGDGTSTPKYRVWNGSTWSSAASISLSTGVGTIRWVRLVKKMNSNEIAAVFVGSNTTGTNVNAAIWNGSSWSMEPAGGLGLDLQNGYDSFDAAYETNYDEGSRELVVAWATSSSSPFWAYATLVDTTWTKVTNPPAIGSYTLYQISMGPSPLGTSNRIALGALGDNNNGTRGVVHGARWNGSSWSIDSNLDTVCTEPTSHAVDVAFAGTTDNAILVFGDWSGGGNIDWARSAAGAAFVDQTKQHGPGGRERVCQLKFDGNSNLLMYLMSDVQGNVFHHYYDDSTLTWTSAGGSEQLTANSSGGSDQYAKESFMFTYETVYNIPTLGWTLTIIAVATFVAVLVRRKVLSVRKV